MNQVAETIPWRAAFAVAVVSATVGCVVNVHVASVPVVDAGPDGGVEAGQDGGADAGNDAGPDAGPDGSGDAGLDGGTDGGQDAGTDAGLDGGADAGPQTCTIGSTPYASRASNPNDSLQCCNPAANPRGWTARLIPLDSYSVGDGPSGMIAEDLDGDGRRDLAVAVQDGISILLQNADGTFSRQAEVLGNGAIDIAARRLQPAQLPDLVVASANSETQFRVFPNLGKGAFGAPRFYQSGAGVMACSVNSWLGSPTPDVFCINLSDSVASGALLPGLADGGFGAAMGFAFDAGPWTMTVGDFRGIGRHDIAVSHISQHQLSILLDSGGGHFAAPMLIPGGDAPYGLAAYDCDRDGLMDLLITHADDGTLGYLRSVGDGTFADAGSQYKAGFNPTWIAVADLNGDQWPDAVVTNPLSNTIGILWNQAATGGGFADPATIIVGVSPQRVIAADFNGDGAPDLAVSNGGGATVEVLLNGCP